MISPKTIYCDEIAIAQRTAHILGLMEGSHPKRIALFCANKLDFVAARDVSNHLKAFLLPINTKLQVSEISHIIKDAQPEILLTQTVYRNHCATAIKASGLKLPLIVIDGDRPGSPPSPLAPSNGFGATIIYTSGTTGLPKGCVRLEKNERSRAEELISSYSICKEDVHLIACPLAHSAPGIFLRACRSVGASTYILPRFDAKEFLAAVEEHSATFFFLVPTQYQRILELPPQVRNRYSIKSVRTALIAGSPCPPSTKTAIEKWLGPGRLWEFYGSSETGTISLIPPFSLLPSSSHNAYWAGTVGKPPNGVSIEIRSSEGAPLPPDTIGEIFVSSAAIMSGYLHAREPTATYISVGDLGYLNEDGFLFLVDRKNDMIISGGVNVYPAEVERALLEHPNIRGTVVFGIPDEEWGQKVAAIFSTNNTNLEFQEIVNFLRPKLAAYKIPKAFATIPHEKLPIGASGKPQRRKAAQMKELLQTIR